MDRQSSLLGFGVVFAQRTTRALFRTARPIAMN